MKKLSSFRPGQERWSHKGKEYSIVDLTAWPEITPEPEWSNFTELMKESYGQFPIELYRQGKNGDDGEIIDRFKTLEEAREAIKGITPKE
jgi:hypothetical protein